jgi:hypothetical protein
VTDRLILLTLGWLAVYAERRPLGRLEVREAA